MSGVKEYLFNALQYFGLYNFQLERKYKKIYGFHMVIIWFWFRSSVPKVHVTCFHHLASVVHIFFIILAGRRVHDRMVVGFITTYAISAYHH